MKRQYKTIKLSLATSCVALLMAGFSSCGKKDANSPGVEFMPDMYRSPSLEYYSVHTVDGDTINNAMKPVSGSVARGYLPYAYPNTPEGYEKAGLNLHNPFNSDLYRADFEKEGEILFSKFCIHCHGAAGAGDSSQHQRPQAGQRTDVCLGQLHRPVCQIQFWQLFVE